MFAYVGVFQKINFISYILVPARHLNAIFCFALYNFLTDIFTLNRTEIDLERPFLIEKRMHFDATVHHCECS